jgi:two-component system sensor histidine kinase/response regulator
MEGLIRVAGNRKLYLKLLRQFVEQQGPVVGQISAALAQSDLALAERLAHTVKGVAGALGAKGIQAAAGTLEKLIRSRAAAPEVEAAKQQFAAALEPLLAQLQASFLSGPAPGIPAPAAAPVPPPDPALARAAATQLVHLLSESDPGAAEFLEQNRDALRFVLGVNNWADFEKLVENYNLTEAQTRLEEALNSLL